MTESDDSIKIPIPILGGNVVARGAAVFVVLAVMGVGWAIYEKQKDLIAVINTQNKARALEHEELQRYIEYNSCMSRLAVYMTRTSADKPVDFQNMPMDLYQCSPRFLQLEGKK